MAVRKMFERKVGMLGKHFTESDWQRAVPSKDEGVDYAVVPKVEVELKPYQYAVLQDLVKDVRINWVWMPPWGPNKITDDGREQLRAIGFTV